MFKSVLRLSVVVMFGVALCTFGCSSGPKKPAGMPTLYPTEITVSSESGPLADAIVTLLPADGSRLQWGSGGRTNASGVARIKTHGQFDGAPEGKFKIVVKKTESQGDAPPPMGTDAESQRVYEEYMKSGKTQKFFNVIDAKYNTAKDSPLEVEVTNQKLNTAAVSVGALVKIEMKSSSATAD